ncbi:MAG: tRNA (guanosine(46)-N7)-methyltransferase TrmB [Candidatus Eisenbacteria bacterium]|nr:tRNA (guanosine(46)-N7)-methyltransferase TrmB [Candidatus Eisenbacteria bacterium]
MGIAHISLRPYVDWRIEQRPIDWPRLFGRGAPLELEIGFGNGGYLIERAVERPERDFVGVELGWESARRALRRAARAGVSNVRVLKVDARVALERIFAPGSLDRVYSLFPCPWPKEKHIKHRLFSNEFLRLLNGRLAPEGEVRVVTDHHDFLDWVLEQTPGAGFEAEWQAIPPGFDTKYERKWRETGRTEFYDLTLRKREEIVVPAKEEIELRVHTLKRFDPERFAPEGVRGDVTVEFKDFLFDPVRERAMLRVYVVEETLHQGFWIEVVRRGDGWRVRPASGCGIVPTPGAQRALDAVRDSARE